MDSFIKKIFDGNIDNLVHLQFQKFSRGQFENRAIIEARKSKDKFSISTTPEFGNELVRLLAEELGEEKTNIEGALITTMDLSNDYNFSEIKNALGVKKHFISGEMTGIEIISLLEKFQKVFFALSFKTKDSELKIKVKAPKTKPSGKNNETPKADFCKLKTTNKSIVKALIFDFDLENFKKAVIKHKFIITDIIIPEDLKDSKDFAKIREMSKRKGRVIRELEIDGEIKEEQAEFEA